MVPVVVLLPSGEVIRSSCETVTVEPSGAIVRVFEVALVPFPVT